MTGKVINLRTDEWKEALDQTYKELTSGVRKNAIIISEMPEDEEDEEGALHVSVLGISFCRHTLGMVNEAEAIIRHSYWGDEID